MKGIKCILLDCMETLVDLTELPTLREYASWGFEGSGVEHHWESFDGFFDTYKTVRNRMNDSLPEYTEYEMHDRFLQVVRENPGITPDIAERITNSLDETYWRNYSSKCYVKDDVSHVLHHLASKYRLGVVSNFMVKGGIEQLLERNGIIDCFDFIVVSVDEGWRKPHSNIYYSALKQAKASGEEILFFGDDYMNDYVQPRKLGMSSILLDRYGRHPEIKDRVKDFYEFGKLFTE